VYLARSFAIIFLTIFVPNEMAVPSKPRFAVEARPARSGATCFLNTAKLIASVFSLTTISVLSRAWREELYSAVLQPMSMVMNTEKRKPES
jgi:hypothetical protein